MLQVSSGTPRPHQCLCRHPGSDQGKGDPASVPTPWSWKAPTHPVSVILLLTRSISMLSPPVTPMVVEVTEDVGTGYPALEEKADMSRDPRGLSGADTERAGLPRAPGRTFRTWASAAVLHTLAAFPPPQGTKLRRSSATASPSVQHTAFHSPPL